MFDFRFLILDVDFEMLNLTFAFVRFLIGLWSLVFGHC